MRRFVMLLVGAAMAALMLAVAGVAWAADEPPPPPPDTTAPTTVRLYPTPGRTGIDRDANIKAKFSEKMLKSSIEGSTFHLLPGNVTYADINPCGGSIPPPETPAKVSYSAKKKTATLNPFLRLKKKTTYTAWVEGAGDCDTFAVEDLAGNELEVDNFWQFTTGRR